MKFVLSTSEWVEKAKQTHGDRYDYKDVVYINASTKIKIICKEHGPFWQLPRKHLRGSKCNKCARQHANDYRKMGLDDYIETCSDIHNNKYDYSNVRLSNLNSSVIIICPTHGQFSQRAYSHLKGHGCKRCLSGNIKVRDKIIYGTNWFIQRAITTHKNIYDYSKSNYIGSDKTILIYCRKHGLFWQIARDHLNGYGCPKCGLSLLSENNRADVTDFISQARVVHGDVYDYSQVNYLNQITPVLIGCKEHGLFNQTPKHHLRGQGCNKCQVSNGHRSICKLLDDNGISYIINDRKVISPLELDIYVPSYNLGIEYHGIYWHSYDAMETSEQRLRHWTKASIAVEKGLNLIQIFEHEYNKSKDIVDSIITNKLGLSKKVGARTLDLNIVYDPIASEFYDNSHLYGHRHSLVHFGLVYDGDILSCMSFSKHGGGYELMRYACKPGFVVVGGPSRLFKHFIDLYSPKFVISYADRRFSIGNMYSKLGFKIVSVTKPNYFYVMGSRVFSRQQFQKHKLQSKLDVFDVELSESENMFLNGYRRLWDAGHYKCLYQGNH